jgi:hypothetical protein
MTLAAAFVAAIPNYPSTSAGSPTATAAGCSILLTQKSQAASGGIGFVSLQLHPFCRQPVAAKHPSCSRGRILHRPEIFRLVHGITRSIVISVASRDLGRIQPAVAAADTLKCYLGVTPALLFGGGGLRLRCIICQLP